MRCSPPNPLLLSSFSLHPHPHKKLSKLYILCHFLKALESSTQEKNRSFFQQQQQLDRLHILLQLKEDLLQGYFFFFCFCFLHYCFILF
jgi:hypothetical protein